MGRLILYFTAAETPELFRSEFSSSRLGEQRRAVRGKSGRGFGTQFSFQWTSGVKGLCVLLLRSEAARRGGLPLPTLEGERGSLALSLDQSIGKESGWLLDIFGCDFNNKPWARKLFARSNPDYKRVGPVGISLAPTQWNDIKIEIRLKDLVLESADTLEILAQNIAKRSVKTLSISATKAPQAPRLSPGDFDSWRPLFHKTVSTEVSEMLNASNIFNRRELSRLLHSMQESRSFRRVAGSRRSLVSEMDEQLFSSERLGLGHNNSTLRKALGNPEPLRIALPGPLIAATALFHYLAYMRRLPLDLDTSYPHAVEIARRIARNDFSSLPDACVLGSAPAASVLALGSKSEYEPVMILPKVTQRIVTSSKSDDTLNSGEYIFINDDPSIPSFLFDELEEHRCVDRRTVSVRHMEPDEALLAMRSSEPGNKAILFFPHYHFNQWFNGCSFLSDPRKYLSNQDTVLFAHKRLIRSPARLKALDVALRDAWLRLKQEPSLVTEVVGGMLQDKNYSRFLQRVGGLHQLT